VFFFGSSLLCDPSLFGGFLGCLTSRSAANGLMVAVEDLRLVGVPSGAVVILRVSLLPPEAQPFAAAHFAVFVSIAAFAWGMWQTWLIFAVGLSVVYLMTATSAAASVTRAA
jgi:hypothetical protein